MALYWKRRKDSRTGEIIDLIRKCAINGSQEQRETMGLFGAVGVSKQYFKWERKINYEINS